MVYPVYPTGASRQQQTASGFGLFVVKANQRVELGDDATYAEGGLIGARRVAGRGCFILALPLVKLRLVCRSFEGKLDGRLANPQAPRFGSEAGSKRLLHPAETHIKRIGVKFVQQG